VDEVAPTPEFVEAIYTVHHDSVWIPRRIMSMVIERSAGLLSRDLKLAVLAVSESRPVRSRSWKCWLGAGPIVSARNRSMLELTIDLP
jgi:hypothetical protein